MSYVVKHNVYHPLVFSGHEAHNKIKKDDGNDRKVQLKSVNKNKEKHKNQQHAYLRNTAYHFPLQQGAVDGFFIFAHVNHRIIHLMLQQSKFFRQSIVRQQ